MKRGLGVLSVFYVNILVEYKLALSHFPISDAAYIVFFAKTK